MKTTSLTFHRYRCLVKQIRRIIKNRLNYFGGGFYFMQGWKEKGPDRRTANSEKRKAFQMDENTRHYPLWLQLPVPLIDQRS